MNVALLAKFRHTRRRENREMHWFRQIPDVALDAGTVFLGGQGNGGSNLMPPPGSPTQSLLDDDFFTVETSILTEEMNSQRGLGDGDTRRQAT